MTGSAEAASVSFRPLTDARDAVVRLIESAMVLQTGQALALLSQARDALREPVRVAVAGRVKAGKSTLVNALVGQLVAPTDVGECTKMVTWYRYGSPQRLEIVLRDGTRRHERLLPGGQLPPDIGYSPSEVRCLEVWLANDALQSMTLIDTPGLASLNAEHTEATAEFLATDQASREATAVADAIVFILNEAIKPDEVQALRTFRESSGGLGGAAGNAIGVLSKGDKLGAGSDWWSAASQKAKLLAEQIADEVVTVVPLAGLMAQTARCAELTEDDADCLAQLAALEETELRLLLMSARRFESSPSAVPEAARKRVLGLLELQGIREAVEFLRDGALGAAGIRTRLMKRSGIEALRSLVAETFPGKGERLKIRTALHSIERLCASPPPGANAAALRQLADELEELILGPVLHSVAECEALALLAAKAVSLPAELAADVRRVGTGSTLAERLGVDQATSAAIRSAAIAGSARWRAQLVGGSPSQARVARIMERSFAFAFEQAGAL
jgi:predicted GTPase